MNYPTETGHEAGWDKGSELRIAERLSLRVFLFFFFFFFFFCRHTSHIIKQALREDSTIKRSVEDLEFSMINAEKVPGSFDLSHHRGVGFAS